MKANPPLVLSVSPGAGLHTRSVPAAPALLPHQPFVCRPARTFPQGNPHREPRPHALWPRPSVPSRPRPAQHPHLSGRTSCGPAGSGEAGPGLPPSLSFPLSLRPARGKRGRGTAGTAPGEGQPGSSVSICHCPPAARGQPGVSAREGSHCNPARLLLTNYWLCSFVVLPPRVWSVCRKCSEHCYKYRIF